MRFSYTEAMCDPSFYVPLARAAEEAGFDSYLVPDSVCFPERSSARYPYTPDGTREFLEDKPFIDPFVLMGALCAVTTRLRFATFVVKLPIRAPVLVAKSITSLAVLSGERISLGIGTSPWPEDFEVTGTAWETRGARTDEMIDIMRGLARGGYFEFHGQHYQIPRIKLCPTPAQPIPILIGGHTEPALRRAAQRGDGFMFAGGSSQELQQCLARLSELRAQHPRPGAFEVHASSRDGYTLDGIARLEEQGVTDLVVGFRQPYTREPDRESLQTKLDALERYGDKIIAKHR
jgi:probable F420-dependent oxidoreductase